MSVRVPITIAEGDGIGPEIMPAVLRIIETAGAKLEIHKIEMGLSVFERGVMTGVENSSWDVLRRTKVFLKAPITTPQGGGFKSLNVTVRSTLGLFANVRPCVAYHPYVRTKHPNVDLVIIRENQEDVYTGIEYRASAEVVECLKIISRPGTERLIRYAFEYAKSHQRKKVTCFTKDNIMKMSDGLFHQMFDKIAAEYPDVEHDHWIVDIGAAMVADTPEQFDIVVLPNLYGDIVSDIAAQIVGSVGLAGSANIGESCAMFEAIHGSAPKIAGQNVANPSGLLQGAIMMLNHIGQGEVAMKVQNAWLSTLEEGIHTADIYDPRSSAQLVGTKEFGDAVIEHLGKVPQKLAPAKPVAARARASIMPKPLEKRPVKTLVGVDIFLDWAKGTPNQLAETLLKCNVPSVRLANITNRGVKVWPDGYPETMCVDHWRCRYVAEDKQTFSRQSVLTLLGALDAAGFDCSEVQYLFDYDGKRGYTLALGE